MWRGGNAIAVPERCSELATLHMRTLERCACWRACVTVAAASTREKASVLIHSIGLRSAAVGCQCLFKDMCCACGLKEAPDRRGGGAEPAKRSSVSACLRTYAAHAASGTGQVLHLRSAALPVPILKDV